MANHPGLVVTVHRLVAWRHGVWQDPTVALASASEAVGWRARGFVQPASSVVVKGKARDAWPPALVYHGPDLLSDTNGSDLSHGHSQILTDLFFPVGIGRYRFPTVTIWYQRASFSHCHCPTLTDQSSPSALSDTKGLVFPQYHCPMMTDPFFPIDTVLILTDRFSPLCPLRY